MGIKIYDLRSPRAWGTLLVIEKTIWSQLVSNIQISVKAHDWANGAQTISATTAGWIAKDTWKNEQFNTNNTISLSLIYANDSIAHPCMQPIVQSATLLNWIVKTVCRLPLIMNGKICTHREVNIWKKNYKYFSIYFFCRNLQETRMAN